MSQVWKSVRTFNIRLAPGITKTDSPSTASEAVSQLTNGCAAHDSSQSTRLEGKNGPHFRAFTSGASRPMWLVGCRLELLMDKSELVRVQHSPQVLDLVVSYVE